MKPRRKTNIGGHLPCLCEFDNRVDIGSENKAERRGYNQALSDIDEWLRSVECHEKVEKIVNDHCQRIINADKVMLVYSNVANAILEVLAKEE